MNALAIRFLAYCLSGLVTGPALWFVIAGTQQAFSIGLASVAAFACLVIAILLLNMTVRPTPDEDRTQSAAATWASDLICILAAIFAGFFIMDGFTERLGWLPSLLDEPLVADVVAFMFLPAAGILAWFVTQSASQSVGFHEDGMDVSQFGETLSMAWADIDRIKLETQYVIVSRVGALIPRQLRTNLVVISVSGDRMTIMDPASKAGRGRLLQRMKEAAPPAVISKLAEIETDWC